MVIALSILMTLLVCLTFTPALMCGLGYLAFWPMKAKPGSRSNGELGTSRVIRFWTVVANSIIARPRTILFVCLTVLAVPALQGMLYRNWVTYDFCMSLAGRP